MFNIVLMMVKKIIRVAIGEIEEVNETHYCRNT